MKLHSKSQALPMLHIDDNPNDRLLVKEAILLTGTPFMFYEADNPDAAIPYFQRGVPGAEHNQTPCPELVLLDYDMGMHTGLDFLHWLRVSEGITSIPVVMFSGSPGRNHVAKCYEAGANYFVNKPLDLSRFKTVIRALYESLMCRRPDLIFALREYQAEPRVSPATISST